MLHTVIIALVLSSGATPNAFPGPFAKEVARVRKLANKADAYLRVSPKTETGVGFARGLICIWDSKLTKPECLHTYVLDLSAGAKAPVSTGITKIAYRRVREEGIDCAELSVIEIAAGAPKQANRTSCFIDGRWLRGMIITDKDDPERNITSRITCIGDECPRTSR